MPSTEYTYRAPDAYPLLTARPPRRYLTGLTKEQRQRAHSRHRRALAQHRAHGITGHDAATILRIIPKSSLTKLYAEKTTGYAPSYTDRMRLGADLKDAVVSRWIEDTDIPTRRVGILANREQPWMRATPTRLTGDGSGLDITTTTERDNRHHWDNAPSDTMTAVAQWSMAVTGTTHWHIAVLFRDTGRFIRYQVERDDGLIEIMAHRAADFWVGNVLQRCAPPLDGTDATLEAVRHLNADTSPDKERDAGEKAAVVRRRLARIQREAKALAHEENEAKAELLALAGDADVLRAGGQKIATAKRNGTFQSGKYQERHPERAARYMRKVDKLDHKAALAGDPDAKNFVPRVLRLSKIDFGFDLAGSVPETTTREKLLAERAAT